MADNNATGGIKNYRIPQSKTLELSVSAIVITAL